ncbi:DUF5610 domain-containing protein [Rhodanobacter aciditrophus]|uniref:DUF5610 domain-containing protein n=1 Tax=Rhodanobacter aciditrophus TaxID=1623218 RepID=A0ABW4B5J2_9GAMM
MSDSLKGLGDLASTYLSQGRAADSQASQKAVKSWGSDGYSPSTGVSRSMSILQKSVTTQVQYTFSANAETGTTQSSNSTSAKNDYSPENVAQRILSHVGNYLENLQENGADSERLSEVLETAKSAVQKGVEDATEKLKALGWLNDPVEQGISETETLVADGFDALEKLFLDSDTQVEAAQLTAVSSQSYTREDSSQFEIKTREGDIVSFNLYALQSNGSGQAISVSDDDVNYVRYESQTQEFAFDFSVEGDLNETELAAIKEMMASAGSVSDMFFSGDVAGAIQKSFDMGFDASTLASFSMTLSTSQTAKSSQAVSAYGQNSGMRSVQEPLVAYRDALESFAEKTAEIFEDFRDAATTALDAIMAMREEQASKLDSMDEMYQYQREMIARITDLIASQSEAVSDTESSEPMSSEPA